MTSQHLRQRGLRTSAELSYSWTVQQSKSPARALSQVMQLVEDAFIARFGNYAGWAHNTLFIAQLASQQVPIQAYMPMPLHLPCS